MDEDKMGNWEVPRYYRRRSLARFGRRFMSSLYLAGASVLTIEGVIHDRLAPVVAALTMGVWARVVFL